MSEIISVSNGCEDSYHMMINSFAASCNEAWETIELILRSGEPKEVDLEICSIYCLNPVKTAVEMCPELKLVYNFVIGLCCENEREERWVKRFIHNEQASYQPKGLRIHVM